MSKSVLVRMTNEQHAEAKRIAKEGGVTLNELFLDRTLGVAPKAASTYEALAARVEYLEERLVRDGDW